MEIPGDRPLAFSRGRPLPNFRHFGCCYLRVFVFLAAGCSTVFDCVCAVVFSRIPSQVVGSAVCSRRVGIVAGFHARRARANKGQQNDVLQKHGLLLAAAKHSHHQVPAVDRCYGQWFPSIAKNKLPAFFGVVPAFSFPACLWRTVVAHAIAGKAGNWLVNDGGRRIARHSEPP